MDELKQTDLTQFQSQFSGADYILGLDENRLKGQPKEIFVLMRDGKWRTVAETTNVLHFPEISIQAQLRNLRKPDFGGYNVPRQRRGDPRKAISEYRLVV